MIPPIKPVEPVWDRKRRMPAAQPVMREITLPDCLLYPSAVSEEHIGQVIDEFA